MKKLLTLLLILAVYSNCISQRAINAYAISYPIMIDGVADEYQLSNTIENQIVLGSTTCQATNPGVNSNNTASFVFYGMTTIYI